MHVELVFLTPHQIDLLTVSSPNGQTDGPLPLTGDRLLPTSLYNRPGDHHPNELVTEN
jgi:hypothetical protein